MKKIYWIIAGGILLICLVVFFWKKTGSTPVDYREIPVTRGSLEVTILSTGIVQPENRLEIKPPIAGRTEEVLVDEGTVVTKGQILFWMSSTERAAMLDAARVRGQAEIRKWETYYKPTPVFAPIDGTIILRNIEPGQTFTTQDPVLIMSDRLIIQAQVDETDIAQILNNQAATVFLDAYPHEQITGHVNKIAYDAKTVSSVTTYIVDVLPDKTPAFVKSGMTANVSFVVGSKKDILVLPNEAIKKKDGHAAVQVLANARTRKPEDREVETGISDGKRTEIISGLSEADIVLAPKLKTVNQTKSSGASPFVPGARRH